MIAGRGRAPRLVEAARATAAVAAAALLLCAAARPAPARPAATHAIGAAATTHPTTVTTGSTHSCAIVAGSAYCWGTNFAGELGTGTNYPGGSNTAVPVITSGVLSVKTLTQIVAGNTFTCALDSTGAAYCWGAGGSGQLGNNAFGNSNVPVAVAGGHLFSQISISSNGNHACAVDTAGAAWCWGLNANGQLGNNSTSSSAVPVAVATGGVLAGKTLTRVSAGAAHSCALDSAGLAYCWGLNGNGQLGNNSTAQSLVPVAVDTSGVLTGKTLAEISAGGIASTSASTCALDGTGTAYCWGLNSSGQLGNNSTAQSLVPVAVAAGAVPAGRTLTEVSTGGAFACSLDSAGSAYCWGAGGNGQLGTGSFVTSILAPAAVDTSGVLAGVTLTQIDAGYTTTCAADAAGNVYCWGQGGSGQLGNGGNAGSAAPVKVVFPGVLTITVPASATLPSVAPGNTTSVQLGAVTVSDNRGTTGAWTATVSATAFVSGSNSIGLAQVSYWSGPATATTGTGTFFPGQPTAASAVKLTVDRTAFSLTGGSGVNSASWNPTLSVAVPLSTAGGAYTATITHSVA